MKGEKDADGGVVSVHITSEDQHFLITTQRRWKIVPPQESSSINEPVWPYSVQGHTIGKLTWKR